MLASFFLPPSVRQEPKYVPMMHHKENRTGGDLMRSPDGSAAFHRVVVGMLFHPGQRSTRSFSMICRPLQALVVLSGKTVFSLCLSVSHGVGACY